MVKSAWENQGSPFLYMIKPVITLFRSLGVDIHPASARHRRLLLGLWILSSLIVFGWCSFRLFYWFPSVLMAENTNKELSTGTTLLHWAIQYLNYWIYNLTIFLGIWYLIKKDAKVLWEAVEDMLHHIPLDSSDLANCRRISVHCVGGCVIAILLNLVCKLSFTLTTEKSLPEIVMKVDCILFTYAFASSALFVCIGRIISTAFESIALQLERKWGPLANPSTVWKYQRQYGVACRAAEELARAFGFILFLTVSFIFIAFVNASYDLLKSYQRLPQSIETGEAYFIIPMTINKMYSMTEYMFCLWLLCHTADLIRSKALSLVPVLQHIRNDLYTRPCCSDESEEVHAFLLEVSETSPTFEVLGLFTLTKQVIISLIGTTLTYLVVLCQFSAAENTTKLPNYSNKTS